MWGQKNSTLTICKSVETSELIFQTTLDSNTKKVYLEKENDLGLICFTCYLKQG